MLDNVIPFSSVILLGVVVAVEDRFGIVVTRELLTRACSGGSSLRRLATMVCSLQDDGAERVDASAVAIEMPEHSSSL
ncbi:MAG TPA: hypothetical protein VF528_05875 [Pyrinomonadaceae bacterium]